MYYLDVKYNIFFNRQYNSEKVVFAVTAIANERAYTFYLTSMNYWLPNTLFDVDD